MLLFLHGPAAPDGDQIHIGPVRAFPQVHFIMAGTPCQPDGTDGIPPEAAAGFTFCTKNVDFFFVPIDILAIDL